MVFFNKRIRAYELGRIIAERLKISDVFRKFDNKMRQGDHREKMWGVLWVIWYVIIQQGYKEPILQLILRGVRDGLCLADEYLKNKILYDSMFEIGYFDILPERMKEYSQFLNENWELDGESVTKFQLRYFQNVLSENDFKKIDIKDIIEEYDFFEMEEIITLLIIGIGKSVQVILEECEANFKVVP